MNIRLLAVKSLIQIVEKKEPLTFVLEKYNKDNKYDFELSSLVYGCLQYLITIDYFIEKLCGSKKLSHKTKNILRIGIYELEFKTTPDYAIINSYVEIAKQIEKPASGLVNGVLRNFEREKEKLRIKNPKNEQEISINYSHPLWMVKNWVKNYGLDETIKICEFNNKKSTLTIKPNFLKISKLEFIELLTKNNIVFENNCLNSNFLKIHFDGKINEIVGYKDGLWSVQGESSGFVANVLNPQKGELILDLCSAPGGKTCAIAELMKNEGEIIALDISEKRIKKVLENTQRLGVSIVKTQVADGTTFKYSQKFDKILIDAPCSNTGVLSKRADARFNKKPEDIKNLNKIQMELLNNAKTLLKKGGELVYSTCSIEKEENEDLIHNFLKENTNFSLCNISEFFPFEIKTKSFVQILQSKHNIDGFFIAKLKLTN
jgi:16S rRNA (cytosine967-C5)-methyltransferase